MGINDLEYRTKRSKMFNIVLFEPEIAVNTANIGRTCYLTKTRLHLIRPLGFVLNDKNLRRVGLDYWKDVDLVIHDSFEDFLEYKADANLYISTTSAKKYYTDVQYKDGDYIMFGSESKGVDKDIMKKYKDACIKIYMRKDTDRSLNLSNCANIILFEAFRQLNFFDMK